MMLSELLTMLKEMEEFVGNDQIVILVENRAGITFPIEQTSYDSRNDLVKIELG